MTRYPHQRVKGGHLKLDGSFRFVETRQSVLDLPPNFFAGEEDVDPATRFALRPVDEGLDVEAVCITSSPRT